MKLKIFLVALLVAMVSARPRYLAIPLEDVRFSDHRIMRRAVYDDGEPLAVAASSHGRDSHYGHDSHYGNDNVDYGAYTGGYGAFGWYIFLPFFHLDLFLLWLN